MSDTGDNFQTTIQFIVTGDGFAISNFEESLTKYARRSSKKYHLKFEGPHCDSVSVE
jgi:hypothetical protein